MSDVLLKLISDLSSDPFIVLCQKISIHVYTPITEGFSGLNPHPYENSSLASYNVVSFKYFGF